MTPRYAQLQIDVLVSAGSFRIWTVGLPGTQGEVVTGVHGIGVRTPSAAAVAEATVGLASELHIPNGWMLIPGLKSITVAAGRFEQNAARSGMTVNVEGAAPNVHAKGAELITCSAIPIPSRYVQLTPDTIRVERP